MNYPQRNKIQWYDLPYKSKASLMSDALSFAAFCQIICYARRHDIGPEYSIQAEHKCNFHYFQFIGICKSNKWKNTILLNLLQEK